MAKEAYLQINDFKLPIHIGVSEEERRDEQTVLLNIHIYFADIPKGVKTDAISDTMCYQQLCLTLSKEIGSRTFSLVEHLAHEIYVIISKDAPKNALISVKVTKFPKISGLSGGICFNYGDKLPVNMEREESVL